MLSTGDHLFNLYDRGRISRRELMQGLLLLLAPASGLAQSSVAAPATVGHTINHVQIMVSDLEKSAAFYARLVGATKEQRGNPDTWAMVMPGNRNSVLALRQSNDRPGVIDHFGIGIANFDAQKVAATVKQVFPTSELQFFPGVVPAVAVRDPDGIQVQFGAS